MVKTSCKTPLDLKVWVKDLQRHFDVGESVRVISGLHEGSSGIITSINDDHAHVSMEGNNQCELKILLNNL